MSPYRAGFPSWSCLSQMGQSLARSLSLGAASTRSCHRTGTKECLYDGAAVPVVQCRFDSLRSPRVRLLRAGAGSGGGASLSRPSIEPAIGIANMRREWGNKSNLKRVAAGTTFQRNVHVCRLFAFQHGYARVWAVQRGLTDVGAPRELVSSPCGRCRLAYARLSSWDSGNGWEEAAGFSLPASSGSVHAVSRWASPRSSASSSSAI